MRVTDEMVRRLSDHLKQKVFYGTLNDEARDARAREFLEVALSHAAGQEAPINPAEIDRKLVGGEAVHQVSHSDDGVDYLWQDVTAEEHEKFSRLGVPVRVVYLTPAQPPASAEVGRKLIDDLNRIAYGYLPDGDGVDTSVALWAEQTLSRMAASSGRKGDEMP